jgi:threonine dehydrogenase-like Zn-dependent dehydrogenase
MKENFRFHTERLSPIARILSERGCGLGLEFLGPKTLRQGHRYSFIHTMDNMLDLCEAVGPNCGLLLDAWHWHMSLGTLEGIRSLAASQVIYVHINDAPAGIPVEMQQDTARALPGETGVIDLPGFLDALRSIGYDGPVVPEPFVPELAALGTVQAIRRVGEALQRVWQLPVRALLPRTMKAVATGNRKAWIVELPVPRAQGNEVVIKLHASPICGSVMSGFFEDGERINSGHEGAGEVVEVAQSTRLKVGDRVVAGVLTGCGRCPDCLRGDAIFCQNRPPFHGTFAQFARTADIVCTRIPDSLSYAHASLMCCGLGPAYESIKRLRLRPFDTILVSGLGPVGLGAVALASIHGARIIAADPVEYRRDLAKKLGAAMVLDPTDPRMQEIVRDLTDGRGVTSVIEASGNAAMERMAIDLAEIRGQIAFVGENQGIIPVSPSKDMIRKGLAMHGCWHMNMMDSPDLIRFLQRWPEKADMLITDSFGFADVQEAFDKFASRQCAKVLLIPLD